MSVGESRVIALVLAALLAVAGCGGGQGGESATTTSGTANAALDAPEAPPDPQTLLRAGATALAQVPGATVIFVESQTDDAGTWKVWLATVAGTEQQVKIGPDGISVLVGPTPQNDSGGDKAARRALLQGARLDYRAAVEKMLAAVHDGSITRLSLVDESGTTAWKAIVWDTELVAHEVTVDAGSGELIADKKE